MGGFSPDSNLKKLMDDLCYKDLVFLVRCKVDMYTMGSENDTNRVRFYVSKVFPADT
jgi:hypothetical protein